MRRFVILFSESDKTYDVSFDLKFVPRPAASATSAFVNFGFGGFRERKGALATPTTERLFKGRKSFFDVPGWGGGVGYKSILSMAWRVR